MQLPAVIAFSGFNEIVQAGLNTKKTEKRGGKPVVYEETSGV